MIPPEKKTSPRFVDREKELDTLKLLFNEASGGHGVVAFVYGEAGIGKTRLVEELETFVVSQGAYFLKGRCMYREESTPYLPFIDALNQHFLEREEESPLATIIGKPSERLDTPMGLVAIDEKASEELDLQRERNRMFETIADLIRDISRDETVVLFLDDLQWADNATLRLFHYVARNIREEKVMIVGAYRPEDLIGFEGKGGLAELAQRMGQEKLFVSIKIERLDPRSIELMVKNILDIEELPANFVRQLYEECEGNPFFVEEVIKSLISEGIMGAFTRGEVSLLLEDMKIPSTIKDVIWRRVASLDDDSKKILMLASVIGSKFDFDVLHKASGFDDMRFLDALDRLLELGLIHEYPTEKEEGFKFDHMQVRAVIYDSLSRSRKRLFHRKVGEVMEEHYRYRLDDVVYSLARHFHIGKNNEKALQYLLLSADKATKQFALEEASYYYKTSLEVLGNLERSEENRELMLDLNLKFGKLFFSQGKFSEALNRYQQALNMSEELGKELKKARAYKEIGHAHKYRGDYKKAEEAFEKALKLGSKQADPYEIADIHRGLGYVHWRRGEFKDAIEHYNLSISNIEKIGYENLMAVTYIELGNVYNTMGDLEMATDYHTKSVDLLEKLGDFAELSRALNNLGDSHLQKKDWESAIGFLERSLEVSERSGNKHARTWALFNVAEAYIEKGELDKAEKALKESFDLCVELNEKIALQGVYKNYGLLYRVKKEWDRSIGNYEKALGLLNEIKVPYERGKRMFELALVYKDMGNSNKARELMKKSIKIFDEVNAKKELERVREEAGKLDSSDSS